MRVRVPQTGYWVQQYYAQRRDIVIQAQGIKVLPSLRQRVAVADVMHSILFGTTLGESDEGGVTGAQERTGLEDTP